MKATTIKTEILNRYEGIFEPVKKVADLKGVIDGVEYRVKIKSGEATKVVSNRKTVWTPEDGDVFDFIKSIVFPKVDRKKTTETQAKKAKVVVDDKWIAHLEEVANESEHIQEGDRIKFRVATSHGKPVCAHVDLYRDDTKVATAGVHHRIGFATRGINDKWIGRVNDAIKAIYSKIGNQSIHTKGDAKISVSDGKITHAEGPINDVLALLSDMD